MLPLGKAWPGHNGTRQAMPEWGRTAKGVVGAMVGKIWGPNDGGSACQAKAFRLCLTEHSKP